MQTPDLTEEKVQKADGGFLKSSWAPDLGWRPGFASDICPRMFWGGSVPIQPSGKMSSCPAEFSPKGQTILLWPLGDGLRSGMGQGSSRIQWLGSRNLGQERLPRALVSDWGYCPVLTFSTNFPISKGPATIQHPSSLTYSKLLRSALWSKDSWPSAHVHPSAVLGEITPSTRLLGQERSSKETSTKKKLKKTIEKATSSRLFLLSKLA